MIPNTKQRELSSFGVAESGEFGISEKDSAHIMGILRDTLYTDKILAILREYSSNAWDAHREAGKEKVPINITLPTVMEPTLTIRDYGLGLSKDDVFKIYTQYGASTKRESSESIGMLGIGCKSAFAYSDSFTVVSWHGGAKRTYVAVLDKTEKGIIQLIHEEPCGEETGVLIQIAAKQVDIPEFIGKAKYLFEFFTPRPKINCTLPAKVIYQRELTNGVIYDTYAASVLTKYKNEDDEEDEEKTQEPQGYHHRYGWVALMGCIPYRINLNQLVNVEGGLPDYINRLSGVLYFKMGEIQVNASREEIKYTTESKKEIVNKINLLVDEYTLKTVMEINSKSTSPWDRRIKTQVFREMMMPIPQGWADIAKNEVSILEALNKTKLNPEDRPFLHLRRGGSSLDELHIVVNPSTKLVLRDDHRLLKGFGPGRCHYFVYKRDRKSSWEEVKKVLDDLCAKVDITGIPIVKSSELPWVANHVDHKYNIKHRVNCFKLIPEKVVRYPSRDRRASCWEPCKHVPEPKDVYVILQYFKAIESGYNFEDSFVSTRAIAGTFGVSLPEIYGYKSTSVKPLSEKTQVGTPYKTWKDEFNLEVLHKFEPLWNHYRWAKISGGYEWQQPVPKALDQIISELGDTHIFSSFLINIKEAREDVSNNATKFNHLAAVIEQVSKFKPTGKFPDAHKEREKLISIYPLLSEGDHVLRQIWNYPDYKKWVEYIQLVDTHLTHKVKP